ncbi:carboxypeptidase-like regulatory domain-containing protein [uncultured Marinobacter sp.]|uniref:carboxypeptidase-like regulatory domain-containing protein n=1 Tax=uncultured Marinobacter sp. TaxID=187379 RepID=UPI0030D7AFEB
MRSMSGRFGLVLVVLFGLVNEGYAGMFGFGKKYDVLLFPEVSGKVVQNGAPVEGLKIIRSATYDKNETQETYTNAEGVFSFPSWSIRSSTPGKAFVEDRLRQVIAAERGNEKFVLWYYVTGSTSGEQVIQEKLGNLNCDLDDEELVHHFKIFENPDFTHNIASICRW